MTEHTVFDIDGTLYRGYLISDFADYLAKLGKFKRSALRKIELFGKSYKAGKLAYGPAAKGIVDSYGEGIAGQKTQELLALAENFLKENVKKFSQKSFALVKAAKKRGRVFAVSLSPIECITAINKLFGFDYVYGVWFESKKGRYTGKYTQENLAKYKKNAIGTIIGRFKLDPKTVRFYGDTAEDLKATKNIPVMRKGRSIGKATIGFKPINPDAELKKLFIKRRI